MKSIGKCLSEKYVLNGIIESHFSDAYAYIFDYMFNFILYNLSLLTLGFLFHHPIAVTIYIIITGSLRAVTGGYHCKTRISCYILSYTVFSIYLLTIATIPMISAYILIPIYIILSLLLHWNKGLIFIDLSLIICATGLYTGYISNIRRHHES